MIGVHREGDLETTLFKSCGEPPCTTEKVNQDRGGAPARCPSYLPLPPIAAERFDWTMTAVGTVIKKKANIYEILLKNEVVIEKGQKIAVSHRENTRWRLTGYAIAN